MNSKDDSPTLFQMKGHFCVTLKIVCAWGMGGGEAFVVVGALIVFFFVCLFVCFFWFFFVCFCFFLN